MAVFEPRVAEVASPDLTISERVFQGLDLSADRVVVVDGATGEARTGAEVKARIAGFAGGLTEAGLAPGKVIALLAPNVPDYITVFHGVAYAGGTITTMNPTYTAPEIHHQLLDSGAVALVTIPAFIDLAREAMAGTQATELIVIGGAEGQRGVDDFIAAPLRTQVPVDLEEFVVVLPYSSGTTGRPKGVMLTHRNIVTNVEQKDALNPVASEECVIAFLPFFHIYGMTVLMNLFLAKGAKIVTMPRFDLPAFLELVQTHKATRLYIVPPVALALAQHPLVDEYDVNSVQLVFSGAAPLGPETEIAVGERFGAVSIQGYGMTELSPISHGTWADAKRHGSSGQAAPATWCRIVDPETGGDLGPDEEGELWIKGPQVMKGYLGNPEATAETLTEDGWLKTGDLAIIDADGFMFIRDRLKELIKYKGFQVAPAEVEAALVSHDAVSDAAVIGRPDEEAGELPIAYVVPAPGADLSDAALMAHCESCLASYKRPTEYRIVEAIPKSASGKILRRFLRDELKAEKGI